MVTASWRYTAVACVFVTCLIMSNILAVKLIRSSTAASSTRATSVPGQLHHRRRPHRGVGVQGRAQGDLDRVRLNLLAALAIQAAIHLPAAGFYTDQAAYDRVLGFSMRLLVASFCAFLVGEFTNSVIMAKMKVATEGRWLWSRTITSTLVAEALDSTVFVTIAFAGSAVPLMNTITTNWVLKSGYEIIATPITYIVVGYLKRSEGVDVYDRDTRFVPIEI